MSMTNEQFVVDAAGNRNAVLLDVDLNSESLEAQEELDCIRVIDQAKSSEDEIILF